MFRKLYAEELDLIERWAIDQSFKKARVRQTQFGKI